MPDIAEALQHEGNVTQEVIPPAISGAEITRLSMYKADALRELASGYQTLGSDIASGVSSALKGIGAGNSDDMARQGALAGRSAVTRDPNGDIQVQPPTGELFGLGGKQYANAVADGTQQQITTNLKSDLQRFAADNLGNPEAFKAAAAGYFTGHTGGLGSGTAGQTALLDARDYADQLYNHMRNGKASSDIGSASSALQGTIKSTQADLISLAQGGMAGSDEFAKTLGRQSDAYNSLTGNSSFGYSADQAAVDRKNNALNVTAATIQGSMATAFKSGGINAAKAVIPSIDDHPGATDADKAQLHVWADGYLKTLQASNSTDIAANKAAFDAWQTAGEKDPRNRAPLDVLQGLQNRAFQLGDPDTAARAAVAIATHNHAEATSGLSPSQHDAINGIGMPPSPNFFSSGRAQAAGFNFDPNHPDLTAITSANGLTANVNKFAAPSFQGFVRDLEARGYNINDLGGYNNREKRGGTTLSEHAFGNAIDINPSQNSFGGSKTNLPPDVSQLAAKWGLSWGGDWQGKKDFMHFEWTGAGGSGATQLARGPLAEGSRSFVNSNPGNIKFGDFASSQGATGQDAKGFAIFPNEAAGAAAQRALWNRSDYANVPLSTALAKWSGSGYTAQQLGFSPNQTFSSLSEPDKQRLLSAQRQQEGWVPGGGTRVASGTSGALPGAPGMTWEDLKNNPYASAAYAHTLAADETTRTRTGEALLESSTRALQNGVMPSQQTMVQIEQLAADNPKLAEKYDKYAVELGARQPQTTVGGGAGSQPFIDQLRAQAMAQPDILARQIVEKKQELRNASQKLLDSNPVAAAQNGRWIGRAPVPLDPTQPQSIPQHFADNAGVVDAIASREPGFDKSVVFKNEVGPFGAAMAGPAQVGSAILQSIGSLPQDKRDATLEMPEVKAAILGMANSPDAQKKQVAFSFMDQIYRQDPQSFDGKFGEKGLLKLRAWQDVEQFKTPEMIAKDASTANDPSAIRARDALVDQSNKDTQTMTAGQIAQRISPHFLGLWDNTPVSNNSAMTSAVMADDWRRARAAGFSEMGDATAAEKYADERTRLKWSESPSNGDRVMTYPPERSPAYPMVNGSHDYIGAQLADFVTQAGHQGAEAHLVPDANTESEMKFGKAPGYAVVAQGKDGQYHLIPGRFYADPATAQAQANAAFRQAPPLHVPMAAGMMTGGVP